MPVPVVSVRPLPAPRVVAWALLALVVVQSGCTSALSTALLRDMTWDGVEHAAESEPPAQADHDAADSLPQTADGAPAPTTADSAAARAAAVEEAMQRLSGLATLDAATEAALVDILRGTPQEDWPVVIEEFTTSLAASSTTAVPVVAARPPAPEQAAAAPAVETTSSPAEPPAEEPTAAATPVVVAAASAAETAPAAAPVAAEPASAVEAVEPQPTEPAAATNLAIRNACFASRVRGWGDVDRFADTRFRPGQELIVYYELDNLAATESAAGYTSRIDTSLRLVDAAGVVVHAWSFEPITETCASRRRDYFARYVVRIPEAVGPGTCRVELAVTDTCARMTATASLPCEIAAD